MEKIELKAYIDELRKADLEALRVARMELERRLADMNEFRQQILDERSEFVLVRVYEEKYKALIQKEESDMSSLDLRLDLLEKSAVQRDAVREDHITRKQYTYLAYGVSVSFFAIVVNIILKLFNIN